MLTATRTPSALIAVHDAKRPACARSASGTVPAS